MLDEQTADGRLMPWLSWWPPAAIDELLPDPADRRRLAADQPRLPRAFHRRSVPVPTGWSEQPCVYLRLSEAYDAESARAATGGWPVASIDSTHLGPYLEPERVLRAINVLRSQIVPS